MSELLVLHKNQVVFKNNSKLFHKNMRTTQIVGTYYPIWQGNCIILSSKPHIDHEWKPSKEEKKKLESINHSIV